MLEGLDSDKVIDFDDEQVPQVPHSESTIWEYKTKD